MILHGSALGGFDGTILSRDARLSEITVVFVVSARLVVSRGRGPAQVRALPQQGTYQIFSEESK